MSAVVFEKASTHRSAKTNQPDTALYSSVWQTSMALRTCCQVRRADGPFESNARSYFRVTEPLEASSRPTETLMDANHWESSECTQHRSAHGMETSSGSRTMAKSCGSGYALSSSSSSRGLPLMMMMKCMPIVYGLTDMCLLLNELPLYGVVYHPLFSILEACHLSKRLFIMRVYLHGIDVLCFLN